MAVKKMQYQNLNHALKLFKVQVLEGIPYAQTECPKFETPEQAFEWLKLRTKYKNDPKGTELFQTLPTLLENNFHGITGHGDCDCFTIAILSILAANNFKNIGIVLVGRNTFNPVHIYAYCVNDKGEKQFLDLTNKYFDQTRYYPYKQEIPFNLTPNEEKNMMLQLAEMGAPRRKRNFKQPTPGQVAHWRKVQQKRAEEIKRQRAEHERRAKLGLVKRPNFNHIYLPSKGVQIREDYFDTRLSNGEFQNMLLSEGYELAEVEELAGRRGERRRAKKQEKHEAKMEKKRAKTDIKKAKAEKKRAKGEAARDRAAAKRDKWNAKGKGGGGEDGEEESEAERTGSRIFGKVIGGASQLVGAWKGAKGGGADDSGADDSGADDSANMPSVRRKSAPGTEEPKMVTIFGKEIKQSTAIIGGVTIAAAAIGVGIAIKNSRKINA